MDPPNQKNNASRIRRTSDVIRATQETHLPTPIGPCRDRLAHAATDWPMPTSIGRCDGDRPAHPEHWPAARSQLRPALAGAVRMPTLPIAEQLPAHAKPTAHFARTGATPSISSPRGRVVDLGPREHLNHLRARRPKPAFTAVGDLVPRHARGFAGCEIANKPLTDLPRFSVTGSARANVGRAKSSARRPGLSLGPNQDGRRAVIGQRADQIGMTPSETRLEDPLCCSCDVGDAPM